MQQIPDFALPVQAVQPVQPKIDTNRKVAPLPRRGGLSPPNFRYGICQKGPDTLATSDQANNGGHF